MNPDAGPLDITIENQMTPSRRRTVRAYDVSSTSDIVTVAPHQTLSLPITFGSGFVRVKASKPFALSARSTQTTSGGTFGSALPASPASAMLASGQSRRFGGVDDSTSTTIASATPVTYRSSLGLIETSGQASVVRVTLRYTFGAGNKASAVGVATTSVNVPANRLLILDAIARSVLGPSRDALGDLRNMQIDVDVISGGRIFPFVRTTDNGSGDSAIRVQ